MGNELIEILAETLQILVLRRLRTDALGDESGQLYRKRQKSEAPTIKGADGSISCIAAGREAGNGE